MSEAGRFPGKPVATLKSCLLRSLSLTSGARIQRLRLVLSSCLGSYFLITDRLLIKHKLNIDIESETNKISFINSPIEYRSRRNLTALESGNVLKGFSCN